MPSAEAIQIAKRAAAEMVPLEVISSDIEGPRRDDIPAANDPAEFGLSADAGSPVVEIPAATTGEAPPLVLVTPPQWRGVPIPPMRWLATNRVPAGDVTILSGDGYQPFILPMSGRK